MLRISLCEAQGPFDLHALDTPPAFILSQDQTLNEYQKFQVTEATMKFLLYELSPPQFLPKTKFGRAHYFVNPDKSGIKIGKLTFFLTTF